MISVSVFIQILNMSLGAAWAVILVMAARLFLRRFSHSYSYYLWGVVLFRLVCPVSFSSVFSLMPQPRPIPQEIIYAAQPEVESGFVFFDQAVNRSLPPATPQASVNPVQLWLEIGNLLWQVGMVLLLLYFVFSYLHFLGRLRGAVLVGDNVWESDRIPTAFVLGIFRPRIYLPIGIGEEQRRFILCHEETHIRRLDHLVKLLTLLLLTVHWFNPVLWLAYFLMRRDMEMSCDEKAMDRLGSSSRKGYSACLLSLSARQSGLAIPLAFGENDVKSRIVNILRYKKPTLWAAILVLILAVILGFCLLSDPDNGWTVLSRQEGIPYHDTIWGETIKVERREAGTAVLADREQIEALAGLISDLEVGKKQESQQNYRDWELRITFQRPNASGVGDFILYFTTDRVWGAVEEGEDVEELFPQYRVKESAELFRLVEAYTFLTDPSQEGNYQVGFMEFKDGEPQDYITVTEPTVGSLLASLLLNGEESPETPGQVPPIGDYLLINMGDPAATYYVYEDQGGYYLERPGDYRLDLSEEVYREIMTVWQTISQREAPDQENGYYTGFQEVINGTPLHKYDSYRGEVATWLAELLLSGEETDPLVFSLWNLADASPESSFPLDHLRIEIRSPENAYYLYQYEDRYLVTKRGDYTSELTEDAYDQIRGIYLAAAREDISGTVRSFYAEGGMAEIASVGISEYYNAFADEAVPEELRLLNFTVNEITPEAGTMEEFLVSIRWDYDTPEKTNWISANGDSAPIETGWRWTDNYTQFRFRWLKDNLYTIVGVGTGGGGQGLEPLAERQP